MAILRNAKVDTSTVMAILRRQLHYSPFLPFKGLAAETGGQNPEKVSFLQPGDFPESVSRAAFEEKNTWPILPGVMPCSLIPPFGFQNPTE
jgi:hypothetical protein